MVGSPSGLRTRARTRQDREAAAARAAAVATTDDVDATTSTIAPAKPPFGPPSKSTDSQTQAIRPARGSAQVTKRVPRRDSTFQIEQNGEHRAIPCKPRPSFKPEIRTARHPLSEVRLSANALLVPNALDMAGGPVPSPHVHWEDGIRNARRTATHFKVRFSWLYARRR